MRHNCSETELHGILFTPRNSRNSGAFCKTGQNLIHRSLDTKRRLTLLITSLVLMNKILCCDWLHERARWRFYDACSGLPAVPQEKGVLFPLNNKSFTDQPCSVKMAGHWLRSAIFLRVYDEVNDCCWGLTPCMSITQLLCR